MTTSTPPRTKSTITKRMNSKQQQKQQQQHYRRKNRIRTTVTSYMFLYHSIIQFLFLPCFFFFFFFFHQNLIPVGLAEAVNTNTNTNTASHTHSFRHVQPDGTVISSLYVHGDHIYHFVTDKFGFTVIDTDLTLGYHNNSNSDSDTQTWKVYAIRNETTGQLSPTQLKVGLDDPYLGLQNGILRRVMDTPILPLQHCSYVCDTYSCPFPVEVISYDDHLSEGVVGGGEGIKNSKELLWLDDSLLQQNDLDYNYHHHHHHLQDSSTTSTTPIDSNTKITNTQLRYPQHTLNHNRQTSTSTSSKTTSQSLSSGTITSLVILIRFADHGNRELPTQSQISTLMNKVGGDPTLAPTGSVYDYFYSNSYTKLQVTSAVQPWITLPYNEAYYADEKSGSTIKFESALRFALERLDETEGFSFRDFDRDGNGVVDSVMFLHSGYGAEWGVADCYGQLKENRIWAHKWVIGEGWFSTKQPDMKVLGYHTSSALWSTCGVQLARIGTICHEIGHVLGLPDLYSVGNGVGSYGVMGNSWGFDGTQRYPPYMSPWSRTRLGWVVPKEINKSGTFEIKASALEPDVYIIKEGFPEGEYLLIENRQPIDFDSKIPAGGILIWHVDENTSVKNPPGYPGQPDWPQNGQHYFVSILQADGNYDLEKGINRGDEGDVWTSSSKLKSIGPSTSSSGPYPNTDSYASGAVKQTGIKIYDFSSASNVMTFKVQFLNHFNNNNQNSGSMGTGTATTTQLSLSNSNNNIVPTTSPIQLPTLSSSYISVDNLSQREELFTTIQGENGSFGCMFNVRSTSSNPILVTTLSFHTKSLDSKLFVEVYSKQGSYEYAPISSWILVSQSTVSGKGYMQLTKIPDESFEDVMIMPGETQAFYIKLSTPDLRYSNALVASGDNRNNSGSDRVYTFNSDMEIFIGSGVGISYDKQFSSRIFNGSILYSNVLPNTNNNSSSIATLPHKLTTSYKGDNGSYGIMFNITTFSDITIMSLDLHIRATGFLPVEIWRKTGFYYTFSGEKRDIWEQHVATMINCKGMYAATSIPSTQFPSIDLDAGHTESLYVTLQTKDLRYTNEVLPVSDQHMIISPGSGVGGYRFGRQFSPRSFDGSIYYTVRDHGKKTVGSTTEDDNKSGVPSKDSDANLSRSISTTYKGGNGSFGCMFDIIAKRDIIITSLNIHTRVPASGKINVEVYSKKSTHYGMETVANQWGNPIFIGQVTSQGPYKPTSLPVESFQSFTIKAGETRGMYVTLTSSDLLYSNGNTFGNVVVENDDLKIEEGSGLGAYKFSVVIYPRIFNGSVQYKLLV